MAKTKTYAEQGLEDVSNEFTQAEENVTDATNDNSNEEFVQVGGLEPIAFFYRHSAPKKPSKSPFKILEKGQTVTGTYERSFVSGKYDNKTYVIRLEDGKLAGMPSSGSLSKAMDKLAAGSKVKITYNGMEAIKSGQWEGTDAHTYTVLGSKLANN